MSGPGPLRLRPPRSAEAVPATRAAARAWAHVAGIRGSRRDDLLLVVTELATNAVLHGNGDHFEVSLARQGDDLRVSVRDAGRAGANRAGAPAAEHGRGFQIVAALTRELVVDIGSRRTEVRAVLSDIAASAGQDTATLRGVPGP